MSFGHDSDDRVYEDYEGEARRMFARFDDFDHFLFDDLVLDDRTLPLDHEVRRPAGADLGPADPIDDEAGWGDDPWREDVFLPSAEDAAEWARMSNADVA